MIRLKSVSGAGFRSFAQKFEVSDLPETGMVALSGASGTGKSSFVSAVAYVIGTFNGTAKEQVSWLPNAETMNVTATFKRDLAADRDDALVDITRGESKASLVGGTYNVEGAKALNAYLPQFFGMDSETLGLVTYRAQRQYGSFLARSDADKKSTLWTLLGLGQYELALEKLKNDHLASKRDAEQLALNPPASAGEQPTAAPTSYTPTPLSEYFFTHEELLRLRKDCAEMVETQAGECPTDIKIVSKMQDELTEAMGEAAQQAGQLNADFAVATANGSKELIESRNVLLTASSRHVTARAALKTAEAGLGRADGVMAQLKRDGLTLISTMERVEKEIEQIKLNIQSHKDGNCPTCKQIWKNQSSLDTLIKKQEAGERTLAAARSDQQGIIGNIPRAQEILEQAQKQHALAVSEDSAAVAELAVAQSVNTKWEALEKERQGSLWETDYAPRIAKVNSDVAEYKAVTDAKIKEMYELWTEWDKKRDTLRRQASTIENEYNIAHQAHLHYLKLTELWQQRANACAEHAKKVSEADAKALLMSDARDTLQGFLDRVVQDVLAEINNVADGLMALVPNVSRMGLVLGLREKRGRAEIAAEISVDGQIVSYTQLSGGQQSVVELLTDLAIWEVVARYRGGEMPGWLVLDEPFDGISPESIDSCLDILERYAQTRLILVIHHATEFKNRFQRTYEFFNSVEGSSVCCK